MLEAFAAQSAQLAQSSTDWTQLKTAAGSGQLRMEPGVAEQAAQHCDEMVRTLDDRYREAMYLHLEAGLGDCLIGGALASKFDDKATADENSYTAVIRQHQQILTDMAATYRAAGAAFAAQENSNVDSLGVQA